MLLSCRPCPRNHQTHFLMDSTTGVDKENVIQAIPGSILEVSAFKLQERTRKSKQVTNTRSTFKHLPGHLIHFVRSQLSRYLYEDPLHKAHTVSPAWPSCCRVHSWRLSGKGDGTCVYARVCKPADGRGKSHLLSIVGSAITLLCGRMRAC